MFLVGWLVFSTFGAKLPSSSFLFGFDKRLTASLRYQRRMVFGLHINLMEATIH